MTGDEFRQAPDCIGWHMDSVLAGDEDGAAVISTHSRPLVLLFWFWLLIGPPDRGDQPVWVIQGGYESRARCEALRGESPNPHWLVCVDASWDGLSPESDPPKSASLP